MNVNKDAFSSGQVGSKIWLCEELEKTNYKLYIAKIDQLLDTLKKNP